MFFRRKRNLFIQNNSGDNSKKIIFVITVIFIVFAAVFCVVKKDVVIGVFANRPFLADIFKNEEEELPVLKTDSKVEYDKSTHLLKIEKNDIMNFEASKIDIYDDYVNCCITITLPGDFTGCFEKDDLGADDEMVASIKIGKGKDGNTEIKIDEKSRYGVTVSDDDKYYYFNVKNVKEAYKNIVIVDPGHGEIDSGTDGFGYYEKDIVLSVSKYVEELNRNDRDFKIYLTRHEDTLPGLSERAEYANGLGADYFVSVHVNAAEEMSEISGTEVYYYKDIENAYIGNEECADIMCKNISKSAGSKARESKYENFEVIRVAKMPSVLCEIGFITNEKEAKFMGSEEGQKKIAQGIYNGIKEV
ncbi:MAG: N-acetylmuramoyl-L-alanine amidase, partial [Firmicutes bacterium]|nr:N-acetylmuramoyl-L-alanine amidase [Bacillota bacterium]